MKIKRHDGENARFYEVNEGVFYKSSTTVLDAWPTDKMFIEWVKDHTRSEIESIMKEARERGSKIHHTIEIILKGETVVPEGMNDKQVEGLLIQDEDLKKHLKRPFTVKEDQMMRGFLNWVRDYKPKTLMSERTIYSDKYRYAGTLDWLGEIEMPIDEKRIKKVRIKTKKEIVVIDWKTGKALYDTYDLQLSSYLEAMREMIRKKRLKVKRPKSAWMLQLGVNKNFYKFKKVEHPKKAFKQFKMANAIWEEMNPEAKPTGEYEYLSQYNI